MIVLFDYDSLVYGAVHKIASIAEIKEWFREGRTRDWMEKEIMNLSINRLSQMGGKIFFEIEETGIEISGIEYFLTAAKNSYRKKIYPNYKANRRPNKWVNMVRRYLLDMNFAITDDEFEADDLIGDKAKQYGETGCIICSIDKDLKTIPGVHFDYYRPRLLDENGDPQLDENGFRKVAPCRGLDVVTEKEANRFFWKQVIMGDSGDNIKGIPRVGKVKAEKILDSAIDDDFESCAKLAYQEHFNEDWEYHFQLNKELIQIGTIRDSKIKEMLYLQNANGQH